MEIRDLRRDETDFLRQMLYTALAWRPDVELPPREWVLEHPQVDPGSGSTSALAKSISRRTMRTAGWLSS